jgi:hypothetical protein
MNPQNRQAKNPQHFTESLQQNHQEYPFGFRVSSTKKSYPKSIENKE